MRVLVLPKNLLIGGSQVNAVDLANELTRRGHEVHLLAPSGPLEGVLDGSIQLHDLPSTTHRWGRLRLLRTLIRDIAPEAIHAYEVRNILDAHLVARTTPVLGTIVSTRVPWFLPESTRLTVGMPNLAEFTKRWRTGSAVLLYPPIKLGESITGSSRSETLDQLGIEAPERLIAMIVRLVAAFKREGILRTIAAVGRLADTEDVTFLIVGDGPARAQYEAAANTANDVAGRRVIQLVGELTDPTSIYNAADLIVGSGTSVMWSAALGLPTVVVGREGFSVIATNDTVRHLVEHGFYGVGEGVESPDTLDELILRAFNTPPDSATRGIFASTYGLAAVGAVLDAALETGVPIRWDLVRSLTRLLLYRLRRQTLQRQASRSGLAAEQADNFVFGSLRNMAVAPAARGTGRNRRSEPDEPGDAT